MSIRSILGLCVLGLAVSLATAGETQHRPMQRRVEPPHPGCVTNVTASERREWTDEIASERWSAYAPLSAIRNKMKKPIRTEHYVVLTDGSCAETFGKTMEGHYAKIREVLGFDDQRFAPRMPIFLFRTPDEYYAFVVNATSLSDEQAKATGGIANGEWYATWYESPCDAVHLSGAARQILNLRARSSGVSARAGSWFEDGVAEYIATTRNERNAVAGRVAHDKAMPLAELMRLDCIALSTSQGNDTTLDARGRQIEAALFIEFLRESSFGKKGYVDFVRSMDSTNTADPVAIDRALRTVYGVGLHDVEKRFREYCKSR